MTKRLLAIAAPVKKQLVVSTLASIVGNLSQMSIMAFGALLLLSAAGYDTYFSPAFSIWAALPKRRQSPWKNPKRPPKKGREWI